MDFEAEFTAEEFADENEERDYFVSQLLETTRSLWLGIEFAQKLRAVLSRVPIPVVKRLAESELKFFAPDRVYGRVLEAEVSVGLGDPIVYLSAELLSMRQAKAEAVIARELTRAARAARRHQQAVDMAIAQELAQVVLHRKSASGVRDLRNDKLATEEFADENQGRDPCVSQLPTRNLWLGFEFGHLLQVVLSRLPTPALRKLLESELRFFAPDAHYSGRTFEAQVETGFHEPIVYLSPELLSMPQAAAGAVAAHELAHVVLGHRESIGTVGQAMKDEMAADELAKSWGFEPPPELKR
jgi:hypothetical protein